MNAGIGGFNTVQEYALLEHEASAIDPDIVALMYLPNDINSNDPPFNPRSGIYADTSTVSHFFQEKSSALQTRRFRDPRTRDEPPCIGWSGHQRREGFPERARENRPALPTTVVRIRHVLLSRARRPAAASRFLDELFSRVSRVGEENGFVVTDIRPWWANSDRRAVTNSVVDWHPNARGHEILAAGIAKVLVSQEGALKPNR